MFVGKFGALVQNFRSIALVVPELLKKVVQGGGVHPQAARRVNQLLEKDNSFAIHIQVSQGL